MLKKILLLNKLKTSTIPLLFMTAFLLTGTSYFVYTSNMRLYKVSKIRVVGFFRDLAIVDFDADRRSEIVIASDKSTIQQGVIATPLHIYEFDGTSSKLKWTSEPLNNVLRLFRYRQRNKENKLFCVLSGSKTFYLLTKSAKHYQLINLSFHGDEFGVIEDCGDIDGDGDDEIISTWGNQLNIIKLRETQLSKYHTTTARLLDPIVADVDGDAKEEIIAGEVTEGERGIVILKWTGMHFEQIAKSEPLGKIKTISLISIGNRKKLAVAYSKLYGKHGGKYYLAVLALQGKALKKIGYKQISSSSPEKGGYQLRRIVVGKLHKSENEKIITSLKKWGSRDSWGFSKGKFTVVRLNNNTLDLEGESTDYEKMPEVYAVQDLDGDGDGELVAFLEDGKEIIIYSVK